MVAQAIFSRLRIAARLAMYSGYDSSRSGSRQTADIAVVWFVRPCFLAIVGKEALVSSRLRAILMILGWAKRGFRLGPINSSRVMPHSSATACWIRWMGPGMARSIEGHGQNREYITIPI
jgi:hypothetical protein